MFYRAALCRVCRQQKQVQLVHARLQDRVLDSILDSIHKVSLSWSMCYARLVSDSITSGVLLVMSTAEVHHISHWFRWLDWDIQVSKRWLTQMQKSNYYLILWTPIHQPQTRTGQSSSSTADPAHLALGLNHQWPARAAERELET
jgi:hypothetical protein